MDEIKKLYDVLSRDGYYTKSFEDFQVQFASPEYIDKVFNVVSNDGLYTKDKDSFVEKYTLKKKEDTELPLVDGLSERSEAQKKFDAAGKRLLAGAARIPTYVAEMTAAGVGMFNPEFKDYYNSLSIDDRETFLATVSKGVSPGTTTGSLLGFQDVGNEAFSRLTKEAEAIESTLETFDTGITEDIFSENVGRGLIRLLNEVYGAIPSVAAAFTPGGIAVIGAGEAASKSRELQEQGLDLDLRTAINATGSGIAEGIFEGVTRKLGKGLFKSLSGKTKEDALIGITKAVGGVLKGMGLEGISEVGTLISQQALDKWVTQDEDAFVDIIKQGLDTFLIGAAVGGPISGLDVGLRKYTQVLAGKNLNKTIEKTKYDNLVSAFTPAEGKPTLELDQIDIINDSNAKTFLEGTLLKQVKRSEISQDAADKILESYDKTVSLYYDVANLNLTREQQIEAAGLIEEKKQIQNLIAGKDEALVKKERDRINEINAELEKISEESGGVTTIKEATKEDALKALAEEGVLSPTDEQILNKLDELTKIKEDAIQKPSPEKVDVQEPAPDSEAVGARDIQQQPITREVTPEQVETTTQPTEEIEAEVEVTPSEVITEETVKQIGDFEVTISPENKVTSIKKKGKELSTRGKKVAEKKLIEEGVIELMPSEKVNIEGITNPIEITQKILDESTNPAELAQAIQSVGIIKKEQKDILKQTKESGLPSLFGTKFTPESIVSVIGLKPSELGQGFSRTWVSKTGENLEDGFIDPNGVEFNSNQVAEFIQDNPNITEFNNSITKSVTQLVDGLKNKIQDITGVNTSAGNIKLMAETTPEDIAEVAEKAIFEAERKAEEKPIIEKEIKEEKVKVDKLKKPEEVEKDIAKLSPHLNTVTNKVLKTNFDNFFIKIKNIFLRPLGRQKENIIQEQIRSTPVPKVDIMIGNKNSTLFYRTLYLPIVESYSTYKNEFDRTQKIITEAEDKLDAESKDDRNQSIINGYKIRLAQLALEHESNPDSDITPSPVKLIDATIRESKRENVLTPLDAKELTNIKNQYLKDGEIKFQDVYNSLSDVQKEVFTTLQEQNSQLESFAKIAAARRGKDFKSIKDYSHRVVLAGTPKEKLDLLYEEAAQFSTQGGTIKEREPGGEPPVSFDPFQSARRGAQETFLDYYMSPKVTKVQDVARGLYNKYVDKSKGQRDTVKALQDSQRELLEITYLRSFLDSDTPQNLAQEITRNSYRLLLGSVPRFLAELGGNALMLSKQPMSVINDAYTTYAPISMTVGNEGNNKFLNTLINLGSTETDKLGGKLAADSKYNDVTGILNIDEKRRMLYNNTLNKMEYLANKPKQVYKAITKTTDFLMGGADKVISRPIWISKFADEFSKNVKKYNKETIKLTVQDFNEISEGTSKYLDDKYKQARDEARFKSDQTSIELITSGNPLNVIIKNVRRPEKDRSGLINYYRTINSFMANFTLNEYATARFAIGALQRSGEMSKAEAYRTLGGLVARMSSYVLMYKTLSNLIDSALGAPEDEEEDVSNTLARQIVGSLSTLMFRQNLGNIPSLPINAGLEYINKNYLEALRNGEPYNAYDNSIVYSLINLDQLGQKPISEMAAVIAAGPLGPLVRTLFRGAELAARVQTRKTEAARRRAQEELNNRITFELIGQLGFIPFFKDIRRYLLKKRFADQSRDVKPPKTSLKELQQIDAELARELRELEKSFRDIEKAFED